MAKAAVTKKAAPVAAPTVERRSALAGKAVSINGVSLAELPPAERVGLLTELLVQTRDLAALAAARNRLTSEIEDLITEKYEGSE